VPLLLITGAGMAADQWPDGFCDVLIERGFRVIRFDNRDSGRSTHLTGGGRSVVRPGPAVYTMRDMADDAVAVLDRWASPR
jgi:pimeloyl-ACP methyl ester carboxylesterase